MHELSYDMDCYGGYIQIPTGLRTGLTCRTGCRIFLISAISRSPKVTKSQIFHSTYLIVFTVKKLLLDTIEFLLIRQ